VAIIDDFVRVVNDFFNGIIGGTGSATESFFDILFPIIIIAFLSIAVFFGFRAYRYVNSYAGDGEPLGPFKITIQGMSTVKGNLSRHYFVTDQEYNLLRSLDQQDVAKNIEDFRQRVEKGELFIYDFRITDYDEAFDLHGGKDSLVLSPVDLEDSEYSWLDSKGERSISSPTLRIKHHNVVCFSQSRYTPDQVMAERDVDLYDLVPIPKLLTNMTLNGKDQVVLFMQKLADARSDATFAEYMRTISENWQEIKPLRDEIERLRAKIVDKDREISDVHREGEHDRHLGYTNPLIGHRKKELEVPQNNFIVALLMMFLIGGVVALIPEYMPQLQISGFITLLVGLGVAGLLLYMMFENKNKKAEAKSS